MTDKSDLSRRVATEIFGEKVAPTVSYATDLNAAFEILEYLRSEGFGIVIAHPFDPDATWELDVQAPSDGDESYRDLTVESTDLPLIICEAALYCTGYEVDGY